MKLTIREAATLTGLSPRTLRDRAVRGELGARKEGGTWRLDSARLPLTDSQRATLAARRRRVRDAVEGALGERGEVWSARRLETFQRGAEVLAALQADSDWAEHRATRSLRRGLVSLGIAAHTWEDTTKAEHLRRCRAAIAEASARLALAPGGEPWADRLDDQVLPGLGGLLRRTERRERR